MAILTEAINVIVRLAAVDESFSGGRAALVRQAPNSMACADDHLWRVGFMAPEDAMVYVAQLEANGLKGQVGGVYRDLAVYCSQGGFQHRCEWLELGEIAGIRAAWLVGTEHGPLKVPRGWKAGASLNFSTREEIKERFVLVRREGGLDVYRDRESGELVYVGRTTPDEDAAENARLAELYDRGCKLVRPYLPWHGGADKRLGFFGRRRLEKGIALLQRVLEARPSSWESLWCLGMAHRAAGRPTEAYEALRRAFSWRPDHPDVAREYGAQCMALGLGEEAVRVSRRVSDANPEDAGLAANLALALLVAGEVTEAADQVARALEIDPSDAITRNLARLIDAVQEGREARPTYLPFEP